MQQRNLILFHIIQKSIEYEKIFLQKLQKSDIFKTESSTVYLIVNDSPGSRHFIIATDEVM